MKIDWEVVAAIAIMASIAIAIWRMGSANPVGTGHIQKQVQAIGIRMGKVEKGMEGCASTADLEAMRSDFREMEKRVASSGEVVAIEGQIATANMRIAGIEKLVERTDAGVARIEGYFLEKGINGK